MLCFIVKFCNPIAAEDNFTFNCQFYLRYLGVGYRYIQLIEKIGAASCSFACREAGDENTHGDVGG